MMMMRMTMTSDRTLNLIAGQMLTTIILMTLSSVAFSNPRAPVKIPKGCPEPIAPRRGTYQLNRDETSVEFICQPGHTLIGSQVASCRNGIWLDQPPVCVGGDCQMPSVKDGSMVWLHGGGIVRIRCRMGYSLSGGGGGGRESVMTLACIDGQWNSTVPQCTNAKQEIAAGKKSPKDANLVGKHPKSEDKMTEERKSHTDWLQNADYSCVGANFTLYPPSVPNARTFTRWEVHDGQPRLFTTYQCKWGFKPTAGGTRNIYCVNSTWIGATPKCQTVEPDENLPILTGIQAIPSYRASLETTDAVPRVDPIPNGTPVHYDPEQGDILGSARRLSHEELLLFADYSCIRAGPQGSIDPPGLDHSSPTLKFVILEGRPHLYTEYACEDGYELENEKRAHVYCKRKSWIGDLPKCIPAKSKRSCSVSNGGCTQLCKHDNRRLVSCSCKPGYVLQPDKKTCADFDECEVNGGDCDHLCDNTEGSFKCSCFPGYTLSSDRTNCNRTEDNGNEDK